MFPFTGKVSHFKKSVIGIQFATVVNKHSIYVQYTPNLYNYVYTFPKFQDLLKFKRIKTFFSHRCVEIDVSELPLYNLKTLPNQKL